MMTLIALGILVSYTYSVAATFIFKGEVFYEAAAMLTSVSLAGHWFGHAQPVRHCKGSRVLIEARSRDGAR